MVAYPRYFEYDGVLIKIVLENDEMAAYEESGKTFNGIGRAMHDGRELTQKEYEQKLRINPLKNKPLDRNTRRSKTWEDLVKEL